MKKRYLIMIIIAIVLVLCIGAGLAFAYFYTDAFKSNKTLFSKYIMKNKEIIKIIQDDDIKTYSNKQKNTPYTSEGTIKTNVTFPDSSEAKLANVLQNCNITINGKTDRANKYLSETIKANYSNSQSMEFYLYRSNDIYALKIGEVLSKYVGLENNNLKAFATKMQLPKDVISVIPDKLDINQLFDSLNFFNDEEISQLKGKYSKIISDNLSDEMFSKEKTSENMIYTLTINEKQFVELFKKILENLKDDELIIEKIKTGLINNYNLKEEDINNYINEYYKENIESIIDEIDYSETSADNKLYFKVYSNKGKLTKTELIVSNSIKITISKSDNGVNFEYIKDEYSNPISLHIQKIKSVNDIKYDFSLTEGTSQIFDLTLDFSGLTTDSVHETSELSFEYDLGNSTITNAKTKFVSSYQITKTFGMIQKEEIPNSEILLINTAPSSEKIQTLFNDIESKTAQLNNAKLQALGLTEEQNPFMYYIPSIANIGSTYIIQNPDNGAYCAIPLFLTSISASMLVGDNNILSRAQEAKTITDITTIREEISIEVNTAMVNYYSENYSNNANSTESIYSSVENTLKNYKPNNENIEYSYNNNIITIKSKKDPSKIITGTLSKDGNIKWDSTNN